MKEERFKVKSQDGKDRDFVKKLQNNTKERREIK
jgi:hypothetical protein